MALDYKVFRAAQEDSELYERQNYFDYNPHLEFLIERHDGGDPELAEDILKMIGKFSAQRLAPFASDNDKNGCRLQWQIGKHKLSQAEYQRFNELKDSAPQKHSDSGDVVYQALQDFQADPHLSVFSDVALPEGAQEQIQMLREQSLIGLPLPEKYGGDRPRRGSGGWSGFVYFGRGTARRPELVPPPLEDAPPLV